MEDVLASIQRLVGEDKTGELLEYLQGNNVTYNFVMNAEINKKTNPWPLRILLEALYYSYGSRIEPEDEHDWFKLNNELADMVNDPAGIDKDEVIECVINIKGHMNQCDWALLSYDSLINDVCNKSENKTYSVKPVLPMSRRI